MDEFDDIRPYHDHEVHPVLNRLSRDPLLLSILARWYFPRTTQSLSWLLRPLIGCRLRHICKEMHSVDQFQVKIEPFLNRTIEKATDGISFSGIEQLPKDRPCLFIANHRDIVMDPAFVNYVLYHSARKTVRIAIGDNLLQKPFVSDLMRLNKSFIVPRSITGRRERLAAFQRLSAYINQSLCQDHESVWIAQAEGRAKDGNDRTDPAILKMFHLSRKEEPFSNVIEQLHLVPVAMSYEYDPCDLAKARELSVRAQTGTYEKVPGEDDASIAKGITGYKGRVHLHFCSPITGGFEEPRALANAVDQAILTHYKLFPVHYLAYSDSAQDPEIQVPPAESFFLPAELATAKEVWAKRLADCPETWRAALIAQYANPVRSYYRCMAGLPL